MLQLRDFRACLSQLKLDRGEFAGKVAGLLRQCIKSEGVGVEGGVNLSE